MSQTTSKVDLDDKKMKIDWLNLKKIILNIIRGDQFLYISSQMIKLVYLHFLVIWIHFTCCLTH